MKTDKTPKALAADTFLAEQYSGRSLIPSLFVIIGFWHLDEANLKIVDLIILYLKLTDGLSFLNSFHELPTKYFYYIQQCKTLVVFVRMRWKFIDENM